ncbi:hypothetical protein ACIRP0_04060 [Streptomyces sp. NPDC101733]|uniref:hypothetical protein n=1 Tax=unclassified Streptomyces TaxID=2593676 RepID=UPI003807B9F1
MRSPRRRPSAVPALLLALALLAGCSGAEDGAGGGAEPEIGAIALDPATSTLALPMDAYTDTEAERIRMGRVQQALLARCMARYGFSYGGVPSEEPAGGAAEDRHRYLFGLADPEFAAAHGYDKEAGLGERVKPSSPPLGESARLVMTGAPDGAPPGTKAVDARSEEEAAGVDSGLSVGGLKVPPGGCQREGYRKLYAPTKDSVDLLFAFDLSSEAHERSKRDSRVRAALAKWSSCMDKSGYGGIDTPYDVIEELGLGEDKAGPKAVTAAKADVACKHEVNLVGIWAAVEKAYQERLVNENAEALALYGKQREARFRLAATLA